MPNHREQIFFATEKIEISLYSIEESRLVIDLIYIYTFYSDWYSFSTRPTFVRLHLYIFEYVLFMEITFLTDRNCFLDTYEL